MTTEEGFDKLCRVLPYVRAIFEDEKVAEYRQKSKNGGGIEDVLSMFYPAMLGGCRQYLYEIAAVYMDKTADEVARQPFEETRALFESDFARDFIGFFPCFAHMGLMR